MNFRPALLSAAIATLLSAAPLNASSPIGPQNIPQRADIPSSQNVLAFFIQRFEMDLESTEHTYDITAGTARENALRNLYLGGRPVWANSTRPSYLPRTASMPPCSGAN